MKGRIFQRILYFENRDPLKGDGNRRRGGRGIPRPPCRFENRDPLKGDGNIPVRLFSDTPMPIALKTETRLKGMGESVLGSRSSAPGGGRGGTAVRQGGFIARCSSPVTPSLRHFITSSLRHFLNGDGESALGFRPSAPGGGRGRRVRAGRQSGSKAIRQ